MKFKNPNGGKITSSAGPISDPTWGEYDLFQDCVQEGLDLSLLSCSFSGFGCVLKSKSPESIKVKNCSFRE